MNFSEKAHRGKVVLVRRVLTLVRLETIRFSTFYYFNSVVCIDLTFHHE